MHDIILLQVTWDLREIVVMKVSILHCILQLLDDVFSSINLQLNLSMVRLQSIIIIINDD